MIVKLVFISVPSLHTQPPSYWGSNGSHDAFKYVEMNSVLFRLSSTTNPKATEANTIPINIKLTLVLRGHHYISFYL